MPWFYRHPTGRPPHPDVLTPAEWRVLEHLRAGRSNPEIADALGVSVNTVRTHVSSMLGKLEMRDREELARWQGEPAEASRAALGRVHLAGPLAWFGERSTWAGRIAAGAGLVAAGALFAVAMQSMNEAGTPGGAVTETPTATATPTEPTPTASSTPSPTATTGFAPLFPPLTVGAPVEIPEGVALYVWDGCTSCDTPSTALRRFERSGNAVEERFLFERTINTPYLLSAWVEDDALYVIECTTGYCGGLAEVASDTTVTLYRSVDDGETWEPLGALPVPTSMPIANPQPEEWGVATTRRIPSSVDGEDGVFDVGGVTVDLRRIDPRGVAGAGGPVAYYAMGAADVNESGRIAMQWAVQLSSGGFSVGYLSVFAPDGSPLATYESSADAVWLDEDRLVGTVVYETQGAYRSPDIEYGWIPSIIDLGNGTVRPILDPFGDDPSNRNLVVGVRVE